MRTLGITKPISNAKARRRALIWSVKRRFEFSLISDSKLYPSSKRTKSIFSTLEIGSSTIGGGASGCFSLSMRASSSLIFSCWRISSQAVVPEITLRNKNGAAGVPGKVASINARKAVIPSDFG